MLTPTEEQVLAAADAIVAAFTATNTEAYFEGFTPDATFIFHPEDARLGSRAEYDALGELARRRLARDRVPVKRSPRAVIPRRRRLLTHGEHQHRFGRWPRLVHRA